MNQPDRAQFERLLHAYELGTLSPAQEEEFELLLLEYPEFFAEVEKLETATHLMRNDPEIREHLAEVMETLREDEQLSAGSPSAQPLWKRLWFAYAAAAAVILLLVLVDWRLEFHPSSEVIAAENRVAVMYFTDLTDPQAEQQWGEIATHLIITDLSESKYMQVVSEQRIEDILASSGDETRRKVDREKALEVARASDARWLVMGEILLAQPTFAIASQLIDVPSGELTASLEVYGQPGQDIFSLVDELSTKIKTGLSLPAIAREEVDASVADVTTHSPDAYRYFLAGKSLYDKFYYADAWDKLQLAVKLDSTFAIAYFYLHRLSDPEALPHALHYMGRASQRDQVSIRMGEAVSRGDYRRAIAELERAIQRFPDYKEFYLQLGTYYRVLGNYERSIHYYKTAIAMDRLYKNAYNGLAYAYDYAGQDTLALRTVDDLVAVAPDEANSWDSKGDIYAAQGRIAGAMAAYQKALTIKPDFYASTFSWGLLQLRQDNDTLAAKIFQSQADQRNIFARHWLRTLEALVLQVRGEYRAALEMLEQAIHVDSTEAVMAGFPRYPSEMRQKLLAQARIYNELGDRESTVGAAQKVLELLGPEAGNLRNRGFYLSVVQLLAANGDAVPSRRQIDNWRDQDGTQLKIDELNRHLTGVMAFVAGDWAAAIANLSDALQKWFDVYSVCLLAQAYLETGEPHRAIEWLEQALLNRAREHRSKICFYQPKIYFLLGKAYHEAGDTAQAQAYFERFLKVWEHADAGFKAVEQARAYLAQMTLKQ
ncbi:tetratricopeptide repeat protein [Candidatus Zixiibacteriota bacterium]